MGQVGRVGAYLPAGHRPLMASAFMTVLVPKVAGVETVLACTPPRGGGPAHPAMLYTAHLCGADAVYSLGGVQAVAAIAFGLEGQDPSTCSRRAPTTCGPRAGPPATPADCPPCGS
jgi:sulfopropanediol 3-dehydrogenase